MIRLGLKDAFLLRSYFAFFTAWSTSQILRSCLRRLLRQVLTPGAPTYLYGHELGKESTLVVLPISATSLF